MNVPATVLKLSIHKRLIGYLAGFKNGKNIFCFAKEYSLDPNRPVVCLTTHPNFPRSQEFLNKPWITNLRLHPILSNLSPEGSLRDLVAASLKISTDNEFELIRHLGHDLPGAILVTGFAASEVPIWFQQELHKLTGNATSIEDLPASDEGQKFSLAGVQMKFSMKEKGTRFTLADPRELGGWIIKTPSTVFREVPANEFTAMTLSSMAGIKIPEIRLIDLSRIEGLDNFNLPQEEYAYAIKRFDRSGQTRIHMEDFAQVLVKYPHQKYNSANYEQIGKVIYQYSGNPLADIQQFARRLLVNILLANGDAHLKNWSFLYKENCTPTLSPAYDILTTKVYIPEEKQTALNLAKTKEWQKLSLKHFETWSGKVGVPYKAIKVHLDDVMHLARSKWFNALEELPMKSEHKTGLIEHWRNLSDDFRIQ